MFSIDLPLNFNSPYKAVNITDFWRRWHMTLSRFLRDYLYIPLGGNRKGAVRRYVNLMITMLLGGLWHGAGWTFVIWGGLHGLFLVVHQSWQALQERLLGAAAPSHTSAFSRAASCLLTFLAVVIAWVFFRATSFHAAWRVLEGMFFVRTGLVLPVEWQDSLGGLTSAFRFEHLDAFGGTRQWIWIGLLLSIAWFLPNSQTLVASARRAIPALLHERWAWMSLGSAAVFIFLLSAINGSRGSSEFIYFNF